jgi:hypothetical protein
LPACALARSVGCNVEIEPGVILKLLIGNFVGPMSPVSLRPVNRRCAVPGVVCRIRVRL